MIHDGRFIDGSVERGVEYGKENTIFDNNVLGRMTRAFEKPHF